MVCFYIYYSHDSLLYSLVPFFIVASETAGFSHIYIIFFTSTGNQAFFNKLPAAVEWACPMAITVLQTMSAIRCGVTCQKQPTCLMFAINQEGYCVITDVTGVADAVAFDVYKDDWYIRE